MKKIIFGILIFALLIISVLSNTATVIGGDEDNPEVIDNLDDVKGLFAQYLPRKLIESIDINSTWFYETTDYPGTGTLRIVGKLNNVSHSLFFKSFYSVYWTFNNTQYTVTMITRWFNVDSYVIDNVSGESHMVIPLLDGDSDIFGFIINKDLIGNPESGDTLTNIWSSAEIGFGFNFPLFSLAYDRAPDTGYGLDYIFQY